MPVLRNIGLLATCRGEGSQGELHSIRNAALAWEGDTLAWVGPESELPPGYRGRETTESGETHESYDAGGRLVVPGLVDCHTHLAFGGSRVDEFEMRLLGKSYLEIAAAGGGIQRTVSDTRASSEDELTASARRSLVAMARLGVTTVECKSGYGLSTDEELKLLRVYERLRKSQPLRLVSTFLGAHVVGPEYRNRGGGPDDREGYLRLLCEEMLPRIAEEKLACFCDVFVEEGAFDRDEARMILEVAAEHGLRAKLHVDQLSNGGGGELAAEVGAISADHLERVSGAGIEALAEAGVVAVSLPFASFFLRQSPMPARRLIEEGVPVAVATDFNPGSAPCYHLPLALLLASVTQAMTAAEVLKGATLHAARAIGLGDRVGSLEPGKAADFVLVDAPDIRSWLYTFTANAALEVFVGGRPLSW